MAHSSRWSLRHRYSTEILLTTIFFLTGLLLSLLSKNFLTLVNLTDLLNLSAVDLIFSCGLIVVLVSGSIDISFAVGASIVQYLVALSVIALGGGNWVLGFSLAIIFGVAISFVNAYLIHFFKMISIVASIATINLFFGLLMFLTKGVSIYDLPDWWLDYIIIFEKETLDGSWAQLNFPFLVMIFCCLLTWILLHNSNIGRQLYAFGSNADGAKRIGVSAGKIHFIAFGWMGAMAGIAGLMQVHYVQEVVPNALYGRELNVLAAVVLGGARLGGGKGSVVGCFIGVLLLAMIQNGLNLLGFSSYVQGMVSGFIIVVAVALSNLSLGRRRK